MGGHRGWGLRWTGGAGKAGDTIAVVIVSGLPLYLGWHDSVLVFY